jgi:hypothetical protein
MSSTVNFTTHTGFPWKVGYPHYGLYQPLLNCFLLITNDIQESVKIKNLAVSRYPLFIFQIDVADNYSFNLVDNNCCENWTVIPQQAFNFGLTHYSRPIRSKTLIETDHSNLDDIDVNEEKLWLQYVWHWVRFIKWLYEEQVWHVQKEIMLEIDVHTFSDLESQDKQFSQHRSFFYKTLLMEPSISTAHVKITQYLEIFPQLKNDYQTWDSRKKQQ